MADADFSLFTSIRYDVRLKGVPSGDLRHAGWNFEQESPFYMLDYHRDRILRAATHWKWNEAIEFFSGKEGLSTLAKMALESVGEYETKPLRVRIVVNADGSISFHKFHTPDVPLENLLPKRLPPPGAPAAGNDPDPLPTVTLVVDDGRVARSEFTHYKTTRRAMYDAARERAGIGPKDLKEVLMINEDGLAVMEGSTTAPYFWRRGRWVTPPVAPEFDWNEGSGGQDGTSRRWALQR
ncbi:Aminotransferase, class IV [Drechmeria coniospora]|uniref:Aminotransferase, class IV n=1 Tax=Drechmeria coniospora TaxID=98403 RepID=A0A151GMM8_DRECN|nr:Aminotransferase, class IV [Drechmeria coniospora]KYK58328.1 Aminotransferase, class IV [Drechmeria coniospora]